MTTKTLKGLIEKYISDFETPGQENYVNIIAVAADNGFEYVLELRELLKEIKVNIQIFDDQLSKMLVGYKRIVDIIK